MSDIRITRYCGHSGNALGNSGIRWRDKWVAVSTTCAGLHVGLEEIDHGLWDVYLGPVKLGRLLEETMRIEDHLDRLKRK